MGNELKNEKEVLSDDDLKDVAGGNSYQTSNSCNHYTKFDCENSPEKCLWLNDNCISAEDFGRPLISMGGGTGFGGDSGSSI